MQKRVLTLSLEGQNEICPTIMRELIVYDIALKTHASSLSSRECEKTFSRKGTLRKQNKQASFQSHEGHFGKSL